MKRNILYTIKKATLLLVVVMLFSCSTAKNNDFSERTKIALRDVGNKLLLTNHDSTSLISPIIELEPDRFLLGFNNVFSFEPSELVTLIQLSFRTAQLPKDYRVEVLQCSDREVAYSYQMSADKESTIIPCAGRYLPKSCYLIEVKFTHSVDGFTLREAVFYSITFFVLLAIGFLIYKKSKPEKTKLENESTEKIGSFYFYPEQNKLVKEAQEIALSKKECELLALFVANPNQIIKREELTKRVWEDNGVFVGRSLDTYISKLRKKLKADASIKLTNVHGVGYKLEID